tara:strand:+ start:661 stop:888 length:228 start_codon:yes stop_codon:yes gene_type:complete
MNNFYPQNPILIRQYQYPQDIERAVYNYKRYINDISIRNYNQKQKDYAYLKALNIYNKWKPKNEKLWNEIFKAVN